MTNSKPNSLSSKHLLGIEDTPIADIELILKTARSFKEISSRPVKKVPTLRGKSIINLFFESSTRTRSSFEIAAKRLSADAVNLSVSASSMGKGESLIDTARNLESMNPDIIVIRHSAAGAPRMLVDYCRDCTILNRRQHHSETKNQHDHSKGTAKHDWLRLPSKPRNGPGLWHSTAACRFRLVSGAKTGSERL